MAATLLSLRFGGSDGTLLMQYKDDDVQLFMTACTNASCASRIGLLTTLKELVVLFAYFILRLLIVIGLSERRSFK